MMSSVAARLAKYLRVSAPSTPSSSLAISMRKTSRRAYSTGSDTETEKLDDSQNLNQKVDDANDDPLEEYDDILGEKPALKPQGVDPKRGWGYGGVHKAIICGKVGQAPVQKILRNGRTVTIFTVGTAGMFDQRLAGAKDLPRPPQWHRIAVHNEVLGAYAVQQLAKNSTVYVEGDIETRVYNDSINGEVKNIPEICVRTTGRLRLIKSGESVSKISFEDLREGLF